MDYETLRTFRLLMSVERGDGRMYDLTSERGKVMKCTYFSFVSFRWVERKFWGKKIPLGAVYTRISLSMYICSSDHIHGTSLAVGHIHRSPTYNNHYYLSSTSTRSHYCNSKLEARFRRLSSTCFMS